MKYTFIFMLAVICLFSKAQPTAKTGDTLFNQTDKQGLKQGHWKVKYPNGVVKYTAYYKDNKPVGIMKRYFDDNSLMAELQFSPTVSKIKAKLYFQAGPLAAEGNYSQKDIKDSTWNYYSYYTKTIRSRESYANGKKHGTSYGYFEDGKLAEEREWKNGISHGIWRQYFSNSVAKFVCYYIDGKRNGNFLINYPDNKPEWVGTYTNDKREGTWTHFDPSGNVVSTIEYKNGVASNADELQAKEQKMLDDIDKQKGKIPEPDETNFIPGPK